MDVFKSLGIKIGQPTNADLIKGSEDVAPQFSEGMTIDYSRAGIGGNARDALSTGIAKGGYSPYANNYGAENLKNTHGEEFHTDNDKDVEKMVTTIEEIPLHEGGEHPKNVRVKDRMNREVAKIQFEVTDKSMHRELSQEELFLKAEGCLDDLAKGCDSPYMPKPEKMPKKKKEMIMNADINNMDQKKKLNKGAFKELEIQSIAEIFDSFVDEDAVILKGGEGTRGGKIIGHTAGGKPIYDSHGHEAHASFSSSEHVEAGELHDKLQKEAYHKAKGKHVSERGELTEKIKAHGQERDKHMRSRLDYLKKPKKKARRTGAAAARRKMQNQAAAGNQASWDKMTGRKSEGSFEPIGYLANGDAVYHTPPIQKSGDPLDELTDLIKGEDSNIEDMYATNWKKQTPVQQQKQMSAKHVRKSGPGGFLFDFGPTTGNNIADRTTALLSEVHDPQQESVAKSQRADHLRALESYVETGALDWQQKNPLTGDAIEKGVGQFDTHTAFDPNEAYNRHDLGGSFDQQTVDALNKGNIDCVSDQSRGNNDNVIPFDRNKFSNIQTNLNGQVIKATSETDAALIKMMGSVDMSGDMGADCMDISGGHGAMAGAPGVTVDIGSGNAYHADGSMVEKSAPTPAPQAPVMDAPVVPQGETLSGDCF